MGCGRGRGSGGRRGFNGMARWETNPMPVQPQQERAALQRQAAALTATLETIQARLRTLESNPGDSAT